MVLNVPENVLKIEKNSKRSENLRNLQNSQHKLNSGRKLLILDFKRNVKSLKSFQKKSTNGM